jgi:hypothetical protein
MLMTTRGDTSEITLKELNTWSAAAAHASCGEPPPDASGIS